MNFIALLIVILVLASGAVSQNVSGSIKVKECRGCEDIVEWPTVEYPAYLGYGPHKFEGDVGIEVFIDNNGRVVSAKALFGHPYFRPMLEKEALRAKFNAANSEVGRKGIFIFAISPHNSRKSEPQKGIINGRAIVLPKPNYREELKNLCATGKVELEVYVSKSGNVLRAKAISGDELLHESSLKAVFAAKFQPTHGQPIPYGGLVVYNFPTQKKCIDGGNLNGKWTKRPDFSIHPHARVKRSTKFTIRLGIDPYSGTVLAARVNSGHSLIRQTLEKQALGIKFRPSMINSEPFIVKGVLTLTLLPNGRIIF